MRLSLALILAVPALAWAQDPVPTQHALGAQYRYKAGDKVRIVERRELRLEVRIRRGTKVIERDTSSEGETQRYTLEVLEANEDGDLLRAVRIYESLELVGVEKPIEVEGIRVLWRKTDEGARCTPEHGVEIPPELKTLLDDLGDGTAAQADALLPSEPVAVGGSWKSPPAGIAEVLGIEPAALLRESKVEGTLVKAQQRKGLKPLLSAEVTVDLRASTFNGLQAKPPFRIVLDGALKVPDGGEDPEQEVRVKGSVRGKGPSPANDGTTLELDLELELHLKREAIP